MTVASASAPTMASVVCPASPGGITDAPESVLSGGLTQHGLPVFVTPAELVRLLGQSCALCGNGVKHVPFRQYAEQDERMQTPPADEQLLPFDELHAIKINARRSVTQSQRMGGKVVDEGRAVVSHAGFESSRHTVEGCEALPRPGRADTAVGLDLCRYRKHTSFLRIRVGFADDALGVAGAAQLTTWRSE